MRGQENLLLALKKFLLRPANNNAFRQFSFRQGDNSMDTQVCGDSVRITMACLLRAIGQLGAQALGARQDGVDVFEQELRATLFAHLEGVTAADTAAGVALAHALIEPILKRLREGIAPRGGAAAFDLAAAPTSGRLN